MPRSAAAPQLRLVPAAPVPVERQKARFQDVLLERGEISPDALFRAIALQQREKIPLSEMLLRLGLTTQEALLDAWAEASDLPRVDLREGPGAGLAPDDAARAIDPALMVRHEFLPWRRSGDALVVALADPDRLTEVRALLRPVVAGELRFALAHREAILERVLARYGTTLSEAANLRTPEPLSCRFWSGRRVYAAGCGLGTGLAAAVAFAPVALLYAVFLLVAATLLLNGGYKLAMLLSSPDPADEPAASGRPHQLPRISILVPLLRESDILDRLIERMNRLVYPRELLEICLVHEADDAETRDHLAARTLPPWMRAVEVPRSTVQTKPRAMNYALDFCRGEIIGIYDAEDAPEAEQLFAVVRRFAAAPAEVACVQCALDYYNAGTNWISRCFAIEYAILFRVILPALERRGLPIPLGGTSVFFRREVLEALGRWDAQNVTEDADLGYRLHRAGYRCAMARATTYEEANYRPIPWLKQRSRWLKGFLVTWLTHMRAPARLWRELGPLGFVVMQSQMLGTMASFALIPVVLPLWLLSFGIVPAFYAPLPGWAIGGLVAGFLATEALLFWLGWVAIERRGGTERLRPWLLAMPVYWPLGALAAAKALWEFFLRPSFWDKTEHGLNDAAFDRTIDALTRPRGGPAPDAPEAPPAPRPLRPRSAAPRPCR